MEIIGILGTFDGNRESHQKLDECLFHAAQKLSKPIKIKWMGASKWPTDTKLGGLIAAPGEVYENPSTAIEMIRFCRETGIPFLGMCRGLQFSFMELSLSFGMEPPKSWDSPAEYFSPMTCSLFDKSSSLIVDKKSLQVYPAYQCTEVDEKFRCQFSVNESLLCRFADLFWCVFDRDNGPMAFELVGHPFFVATLYQPPYTSTEENPHPLVVNFLRKI